MAKKRQKTKEAPPTLQNGAKPADQKTIGKLLMEVGKEELSAFETSDTAVQWLSKFIEKYLIEISKPKHSPGQQLKLTATNTFDDLMDFQAASQGLADKFYNSRTIKSGRALRKIYLEISKLCLSERKVVLSKMGKKRAKHEDAI